MERLTERANRLLAVVLEHLIASGGDLRTILLQAGQNGEIALVDHGAAETLHVAGTRLLLLRRAAALLLGEGVLGDGGRQQSECEEKFTHRIPSFRQQNPVPELRFGITGRIWWDGRRRVAQQRRKNKRWQMRPNLRRIRHIL
jgi:hypothetical protein